MSYAFDQFIPPQPMTQTSPGTFFETSQFARLKGNRHTSNEVGFTKYGYRDDTQTAVAPISAKHCVQATNYVKSVKLAGYIGTTQISEYQTWMRVYREVFYPSTVQKWRDHNLSVKANPLLPTRGLGLPGLWEGSIPDDGYVTQFGQYVLLWLRWNGNGGLGVNTPYGILFDWYFSGASHTESTIDKDLSPSRSGGSSKSHTTSFKLNGINSTYSDSLTGQSMQGVYLANLSEGGQASARYYLHDDTNYPVPVLTNVRKVTINVPTVLREKVQYTGTDIGLWREAPLESIVPFGAKPGQRLGVGENNPLADFAYSSLVLKRGSSNALIILDDDTNSKIERHLTIANEVSFDLSQSGGITIVPSGSNQNYVEPNITFGYTPNAVSVWEVRPIVETSLEVVIVDGGSDGIAASAAPADNQWISGFAPATGSINDIVTARAHYWYALPVQTRNPAAGGCVCAPTTVNASQAKSNFTSPGAGGCYQGLHFGKFLKDTSHARGFTLGEAGHWPSKIDAKARAVSSNNLIKTKFIGYYSFDTIKGKEQLAQISFSLANVPGFSGGSNQNFPNSSGTGTPSGTNTDTTGATTDVPTLGGGSNPYSGPPKDWKKAITDSFAKLVDGSAVEKLTPERLAKFLKNRLAEGAPLALLKALVVMSIFDAKLVVLQSTGLTRALAIEAVYNDPLYISFTAVLDATKAMPSGNTNQNESNSDSNATKTIRINVVRGLPGYRPNTRPTASVTGQPELVQTYAVSTDGVWGTAEPRSFVFPFVPKEVTYSGIGTQWTEIPRSGNYPIVDWTGFNLLKISFNFDIVNMDYEGKQGFGLNYSCEGQITKLREMAQTPYPVTFLNMDKFMTNEVRWPLLTSGRGVEFVINEFSVTAVQRTGGGILKDGSDANQISRATCSMTLQEIPIETLDIVQMPPIKPCPKKKCPGKIPTPEKLKEYLLFVEG